MKSLLTFLLFILIANSAISQCPGTAMPTDVCLDDAVYDLCAVTPYDATAGQSGFALVLVTDDKPSEITFVVNDLAGNLMFDENTFPGSPGTGNLVARTVYVLFDNSCIPVGQTIGVPDEMNGSDLGDGEWGTGDKF